MTYSVYFWWCHGFCRLLAHMDSMATFHCLSGWGLSAVGGGSTRDRVHLTCHTELVLLQSSLGKRLSPAPCDLSSIMQRVKAPEVDAHPAALCGAPELLRTHSVNCSVFYFQAPSPSARTEGWEWGGLHSFTVVLTQRWICEVRRDGQMLFSALPC